MCKLGVISQERLKTEVKLLLSVNGKSCHAASIGTTTDDLACPRMAVSSASSAIPAVAELLVMITMNLTPTLFLALHGYHWRLHC